jgi:uncharacterized membrane protein YccC
MVFLAVLTFLIIYVAIFWIAPFMASDGGVGSFVVNVIVIHLMPLTLIWCGKAFSILYEYIRLH